MNKESKGRYVIVVYPKGQKEEIGYLGSPDSSTKDSVLIGGAWYVKKELEAKGFTFHPPIALTPQLIEAMKTVVSLGEANASLISFIDGEKQIIRRALDEFKKALIIHVGSWRK